MYIDNIAEKKVKNQGIAHKVTRTLDQFREAGIETLHIIVGYRKEAIMNYLGNGNESGFFITSSM